MHLQSVSAVHQPSEPVALVPAATQVWLPAESHWHTSPPQVAPFGQSMSLVHSLTSARLVLAYSVVSAAVMADKQKRRIDMWQTSVGGAHHRRERGARESSLCRPRAETRSFRHSAVSNS